MRALPALAYLGLGSNLGDSLATLRAACAALNELPETTVERVSPVYRTAPLGVGPQPDYLNACCEIRTRLEPPALLVALLAIERRFGRIRAHEGAPRTLDLDLLLYGDEVCVSRELTLPHPRLHERAFVLGPLADLAPDLVVPRKGPVRLLLARCQGQRIEPYGILLTQAEAVLP